MAKTRHLRQGILKTESQIKVSGNKLATVMIIVVLMFASALASTTTQEIPDFKDGGGGGGGYPGLNSELRKLDQLFRFGDRGMYDRRQTPAAASGTATQVHIEMYIRSFGSINPIQMDYTVDLYLRQRWCEFRFLNNTLKRPLDVSDPILVKMLWKPEVYFPNAKESDFQYVTVPNVMLRIHPDGTILYILRLKLTFSCMMDLSSFPLDHQTCYMQVASFVKTTRELELVWYKNDPIKIYKSLKLPQFEMKAIKASNCTLSFHIGNYSCLQAVFELRRNVGYHLVQSYLPTSLIVVVSWVSFWLDVDAIPSRVTLGVTTLLTVCSESTSFRDKMPTVSYVKALDIWMGSCTAFVFLALVEFTVVNHLARHHRRFLFWGSAYARQTTLASAIANDDLMNDALRFKPYSKPSSSKKKPSILTHTSTQSFILRPTSTCKGDKEESEIRGTQRASSSGHLEGSTDEDPGVYEILPKNNPHPRRTLEDEEEETSLTHISRRRGGGSSSSPSPSVSSAARQCVQPSAPSTSTHLDYTDVTNEFQVNDCPEGHDCDTIGGGHRIDLRSDISDPDLSSLPTQWRQEAVMAKNIDKICRTLFPALFLLFNIIYWIYYKVLT